MGGCVGKVAIWFFEIVRQLVVFAIPPSGRRSRCFAVCRGGRIPPNLVRRSGDAARGTAGIDLIRVIEWGQAGSDALKPYKIVG